MARSMKKRSRRTKRRRKSRKSKTRRKRGGIDPVLTSSDARAWNANKRAQTQTDRSSPTYGANYARVQARNLSRELNREEGYEGRQIAKGQVGIFGGMNKKRKRKRKKRRTKKR